MAMAMEEEGRRCGLCRKSVTHVAYGECRHQVCVKCMVRRRLVDDDFTCRVCFFPSPSVFVTPDVRNLDKIDFSTLPIAHQNGEVGQYWFRRSVNAYIEDQDSYLTVRDACRLRCAVCGRHKKSFESIKEHLSRRHERFFCTLCVQNNQVSLSEQQVYSESELKHHTFTAAHPFCKFCYTHFFDENALLSHMSDIHLTCSICERLYGKEGEYYCNYADLEIHFSDTHFLCEEVQCLQKHFVVFDTADDLEAHAKQEHGAKISSNQGLPMAECILNATYSPGFFLRKKEELPKPPGLGLRKLLEENELTLHGVMEPVKGMPQIWNPPAKQYIKFDDNIKNGICRTMKKIGRCSPAEAMKQTLKKHGVLIYFLREYNYPAFSINVFEKFKFEELMTHVLDQAKGQRNPHETIYEEVKWVGMDRTALEAAVKSFPEFIKCQAEVGIRLIKTRDGFITIWQILMGLTKYKRPGRATEDDHIVDGCYSYNNSVEVQPNELIYIRDRD